MQKIPHLTSSLRNFQINHANILFPKGFHGLLRMNAADSSTDILKAEG